MKLNLNNCLQTLTPKKVYESEHVHSVNKRLRVTLDAKYEKSDLHTVMETQCQHLTMTQSNNLPKLLQRFKKLLDEALGTWKTDPVDSELK